MFSGLIEEVGRIRSAVAFGDGVEFVIEADLVTQDCRIDDSIAVQGVCLTVVQCDSSSFRVQAIEQTLMKTSLGQVREGSRVNLERALLPTSRLGGHFVQGHVDGLGRLEELHERSASHELWFSFDPAARALVVRTGSICVNGISLTVADTRDNRFMVAIIPHTWSHTTISDLKPGSEVNLEFDVLGKYVLAAMQARQ